MDLVAKLTTLAALLACLHFSASALADPTRPEDIGKLSPVGSVDTSQRANDRKLIE